MIRAYWMVVRQEGDGSWMYEDTVNWDVAERLAAQYRAAFRRPAYALPRNA